MSRHVGMDQYLLWTSIYQLFWCSPGVQGFDTLPCVGVLDATLCRGEVIQFTAAFPACVNYDPGRIIDGTTNSDMDKQQ